MLRYIRWVHLLSVIVLLSGSYIPAASAGTLPGGEMRSRPYSHETPVEPEADQGPPFRLSEGDPDFDPAAERPPLVESEPLSVEDLQAVLDRLSAVQAEDEDEQEYRLPEETLPPPQPGEQVDLVFPPEESEGSVEVDPTAPLSVVRVAPEGDVPIVPQLSVTFNQPMVPLTSQAELDEQDVPVTLTPDIPGHWRWVGTRTLFFEADVEGVDRFPMATEYTVVIEEGTTSANGNVLEEPVSWTFRTPPPSLQSTYPNGASQPLDPILFASFDQRIDPNAVLESVQLRAGQETIPVRMATEEEIAEDDRIQRLIDSVVGPVEEGRWLAFRPMETLPTNTTITVNFREGLPSAEGPLTTETVQSYSFQTYGPLLVEESRCSWEPECPPFSPWQIYFSNPIDVSSFDPSMVTVEPEVSALDVEVFGATMNLRGNTQGRTTYEVTLSPDLQDVFGQRLGEPVTVTFEVGSSQPQLMAPGDAFMVMDPSGPPAFSIYSINIGQVNVRAYQVEPQQYTEYLDWLRTSWRQENGSPPPGELTLDRQIQVQAEPDVLTETTIDLQDALKGETGSLILIVEPQAGPIGSFFNTPGARRIQSFTTQRFIQVTDIGLDAFVDNDTMLVWANRLADGAPLGDVEVELWPTDTTGTTNETGTAVLPLSSERAQLLLARQGDDTALLPYSTYYYGSDSGWRKQQLSSQSRFYVIDDRAMYRPGETVSIKGWVRQITPGPEGDISLTGVSTDSAARYEVIDPQGNQIGSGEAALNSLGGFHFQFDLPTNVNLGYAYVEIQTPDGDHHSHSFQIQEFRRPEFQVNASASEGPHLVEQHAIATVNASYFAGGPLAGAEVNWNVSARDTSYTPPNWGAFTFGAWTPWWRFNGGSLGTSGQNAASFSSRTNAAGEHNLLIDFEQPSPPLPQTLSAEATVFDVNRQAWTAGTDLLVHPASRYVGLRTDRYFVAQGEPLEVELVVTDIDGNAISDYPVTLRAARLDWELKDGEWHEVEEDIQTCEVRTTAADDPEDSDAEFAVCTVQFELGGQVRLTATVEDDQGRLNQTELTRWIGGGERPPSREVEQEQVQLIPNAERYQPGDVAEILVQAPFYPAEGVLTLRRDGLVSEERFTMDEPTYTLEVPIEEQHIPNVHVQVDLVGAAERTDDEGMPLEDLPQRPAFARGRLNLTIPPISRTLKIEATPAESRLAPGEQTTIDVAVTDAGGEAVEDAELAVVVVDEAVLALTNYQLTDPLAVFYSQRGAGVQDYHNRHSLMLLNPELLAEAVEQPMALDGAGEADMARSAAGTPAPSAGFAADEAVEEEAAMMDAPESAESEDGAIRVRTNFDPLALFAPEVRTDEEGRATVEVTLPDNLTRYRIMVVAVAGEQFFGSSEANLTARLPLMVRPSAPRFLNFGDRFELPVVLQNQTDDEMTVDVAVQAGNADLTGGGTITGTAAGTEAAGLRVNVPANDRVEVRFPTATELAGTARFQLAGVSEAYADAAEVSLPVYTPATTEAFAVYGEVDESGSVLQPVLPPDDVIPDYGGLEVAVSSTALQALTDAFLYLIEYPFECSEQIASRMLAVAALSDVLTAFEAEGLPAPGVIDATMQRDIETLATLQSPGGGFPIWRAGGEIWPYYSIHAAHALARARLKDYSVPEETISRSLNYLRNIENNIPGWYSQTTRDSLIAYALYVRNLLGDTDPGRARTLIAQRGLDNLSLETIGWLLSVVAGDPASEAEREEILRYLTNRVSETAAAANFVDRYSDDNEYLILHSDRRTDAVILEALMVEQPESDLIPKLVRGLLGHRTKGRWSSTQENAWVLLALDTYFNQYEAQTPDFVARVWLGDQYAGMHQFEGRSTETVNLDIPMEVVQEESRPGAADGTVPLILQKDGTGRLYYRLGMRYAPTDLVLEPADFGFAVERVYEPVDDPADVVQDDEGIWHIKSGTRVRVRVTMVAPDRRYHVALADPLPAGLEILNPALEVTGSLPQDPGERSPYSWWWGTWYEHQNLRDQRAEAFSSLVWGGVYEYTYVARATTPGEFIVPPAKAEEMYHPETFGRSGTDQVVVE